MWEFYCPSIKRSQEDCQEDCTSADACDSTAEGIPARRVQGYLKWKNEKNTFYCLFCFKLQGFHYVYMSLALISCFWHKF